MIKSITSAVNSGHGNALLYVAGISFILSDITPTPADAVYFRFQQKNKAKLEAKELTPKQYWTRDAVMYYGLNPLWWSLVFGAVYLTKGDYNQKLKVGFGLLATGVVVGVLNKNIKKDESLIKK